MKIVLLQRTIKGEFCFRLEKKNSQRKKIINNIFEWHKRYPETRVWIIILSSKNVSLCLKFVTWLSSAKNNELKTWNEAVLDMHTFITNMNDVNFQCYVRRAMRFNRTGPSLNSGWDNFVLDFFFVPPRQLICIRMQDTKKKKKQRGSLFEWSSIA